MAYDFPYIDEYGKREAQVQMKKERSFRQGGTYP